MLAIFYKFPERQAVVLYKEKPQIKSWHTHTHTKKIEYLLQIICCEHTCNVSTVPSSFVNCVRNTIRQRVDFFLLRGPDWSGNRCSTSTFRSFSMPTQSHVADISFSGFNSISMTIVPSSFFSMHCVEFLPDTLHA